MGYRAVQNVPLNFESILKWEDYTEQKITGLFVLYLLKPILHLHPEFRETNSLDCLLHQSNKVYSFCQIEPHI